MAEKSGKLIVSLSPAARATLDEIWDWNSRTYGAGHADSYIAFLLAETSKLSRTYFAGKPVHTRPNLAYITIRQRRGGHGHVAVYALKGNVIRVLKYYHTAQNWQVKLLVDFP